MIQNLKAFVQSTRIGDPTDHKENMYRKVEQREKRVGECRASKSRKKTKTKLS